MPNTGLANISKKDLLKKLAQSNCEMAHNVKKGTYPIFGYPLLCFSPPEGSRKDQKTNWQMMFQSTMKNSRGYNEISELLNGFDNFSEK